MFLRRCGLESRPVVPKHDRSRLVAHTWMSVVLTPMSVKVKTASKIRRDPARRKPALTAERATATHQSEHQCWHEHHSLAKEALRARGRRPTYSSSSDAGSSCLWPLPRNLLKYSALMASIGGE